MPNCFQLTRKNEKEPSKLTLIDEEICKHFRVAPDPVKWFHNWYDIIGLSIAMGDELGSEKLRANTEKYLDINPQIMEVLSFLEENYTSCAWHAHK